ncbi:MAG: hypothetical protein M1274_15320 [Actinobacteria bacterium]|nr:hypothetical protein [Actinomycetota bacterium]
MAHRDMLFAKAAGFTRRDPEAPTASSNPTGMRLAGVKAIKTVMYSTGYNDAGAEHDGAIRMEAEELREVARLAGLPQELESLDSLVYVDRHCRMHLPLDVAEKLAQSYAGTQSEMVLIYIEDEEEECKARG